MRFHYFDNFRAIAIIIIIAGHSYGSWDQDMFFERVFVNALTGGTALFVFISGFFYRQVFYDTFKYSKFMWKKFVQIYVPYLFLSVAFMGIAYLVNGKIEFALKQPNGADFPNSAAFVANILMGSHLSAYWYIPFVMLVFIISPLVNIFIRRSLGFKVIVLLAMFGAASIMQRPWLNINFVHNLLYFLPFYLFGVVYAEHLDVLNKWLKQNTVMCFCVWISVILLMTYFGQHGNVHKFSAWSYGGFDWMVPQKIALIVFLISVLIAFYDRKITYLRKIADMSFGLFFIHNWVLTGIGFTDISDYFGELGGFVVVFCLTLSGSILTVLLIRKILGAKSRYFIGC